MDLLICVKITGPNENRGSWVHPDVAIHLAQWISQIFNIKVTKWVRELMTTGTVTLGREKLYEELDRLYMYKIHEKDRQLAEKDKLFMSLQKKHNNSLERHS
jgi:hypothetical protein